MKGLSLWSSCTRGTLMLKRPCAEFRTKWAFWLINKYNISHSHSRGDTLFTLRPSIKCNYMVLKQARLSMSITTSSNEFRPLQGVYTFWSCCATFKFWLVNRYAIFNWRMRCPHEVKCRGGARNIIAHRVHSTFFTF